MRDDSAWLRTRNCREHYQKQYMRVATQMDASSLSCNTLESSMNTLDADGPHLLCCLTGLPADRRVFLASLLLTVSPVINRVINVDGHAQVVALGLSAVQASDVGRLRLDTQSCEGMIASQACLCHHSGPVAEFL